MKITSDFDGGNIHVLDASDFNNVRLLIEKDNASDFYQWFYFRIDGVKGVPLTLKIENAGGASFAGGFETFRACVSYDQKQWVRTETAYENGTVIISLCPEEDRVWLASFSPYSHQRHQAFIKSASGHTYVSHSVLGQTLDGHDIDLLQIGEAHVDRKPIWITARQHPGEVMGAWWIEGFMARLLDAEDEVSKRLRRHAEIYVVPNMNPDGAVRGNLRTNAAGANLNREWGVSTLERSPEVHYVSQAMRRTGVSFALDVHGEELLPYCFLAGAGGIPSFDARRKDLEAKFLARYMVENISMQAEHGYPIPACGEADLGIQTYWAAEEFGCVALTLEMPFCDDANNPDPVLGWSPARAAQLGGDAVSAIDEIFDAL